MKKFMVGLLAVSLLITSGIVVFAGPDDKGPVNSPMVTVPNVVGKSLVEAIAILSGAGLGRETQLSDRDGEKRVVIRQDPAAGNRVLRGTVVKIFGRLAIVQDDKGTVTLPRR